MATDTPSSAGDRRTEHCDTCGQITNHEVTVEIRTESAEGGENSKFSREPYRVAECRVCGDESTQRMNNA